MIRISDVLDLTVGAGAIYFVYKHHTVSQVVASVKAEVAAIEKDIASGNLAAVAVADAKAIVARLKALL